MKKCTKCNEIKSSEKFAKDNRAKDGRASRCKECCNNAAYKRYLVLRESQEWWEKERKRCNKKYKRLGYIEKYKEERLVSVKKYVKKYPEKILARNSIQRTKRQNGYNFHHWSYNIKHRKDIITLTRFEHEKIHRFMIYDKNLFLYRIKETGILLDTKERHIEFINSIITNI